MDIQNIKNYEYLPDLKDVSQDSQKCVLCDKWFDGTEVNYPLNHFLLVHEKCLKENIDFEIICLDDHSDSDFTKANKKIEKLTSCYYKISSENKGRVATREHLAKLAKNKLAFIVKKMLILSTMRNIIPSFRHIFV